MVAKYKAIEIADFYIQLINSIPDNTIDNLKLNKLLYYVQGFSLVKLGYPMFDENIQAWDYGPVIPEIYHVFKCCGKNSIEEPTTPFDESRFSTEELNLLIDIYNEYGKYTGWALKNMTHEKGSPWAQVYEKNQNKVITKKSIEEYFKNLTLPSFTVDNLNIPTVTELPAAWDRKEDSIYDTV